MTIALHPHPRGAGRTADDVLHRPDATRRGFAGDLDLAHVPVVNGDQVRDRIADHLDDGRMAPVDAFLAGVGRLPHIGQRMADAADLAKVEDCVWSEHFRQPIPVLCVHAAIIPRLQLPDLFDRQQAFHVVHRSTLDCRFTYCRAYGAG